MGSAPRGRRTSLCVPSTLRASAARGGEREGGREGEREGFVVGHDMHLFCVDDTRSAVYVLLSIVLLLRLQVLVVAVVAVVVVVVVVDCWYDMRHVLY